MPRRTDPLLPPRLARVIRALRPTRDRRARSRERCARRSCRLSSLRRARRAPASRAPSGGSRPFAAPRRAGARCRPRTAARRASRGCASGMVEAARRRQPWTHSCAVTLYCQDKLFCPLLHSEPARRAPIRVLFRDFAPEDFTIELTNAVSILSRNENRREPLLPFQEKT